MAPTPYTPNGQLDIILVVSGLTHRIQLPVDITGSPGSYAVVNRQPLGSNQSGGYVGQLFWDKAKALYAGSVAAPEWELQAYDSGAFTPVDGGTLSGAGTNGGSPGLGWASTLTFRDDTQHLIRLVLPENCTSVLVKAQYSGLGADVKALIDQYVVSTVGADVRDFVVSRADESPNRFLWFTNTPNRKLRKARGLA